ncbi:MULTISPECIES: hypothetical protein [unclassified Streptomyces]|uniref:hypothetical protein n=1 Tax=unclassified Streptomyces TaxID=2593676 RepID=UPI001908C8E5|nr:hypothetical protein [Streptomyces sp. HSG2]
MSAHQELNNARHALDDLLRSVGNLERRIGGEDPGIRRVRTDVDHLREDLAALSDTSEEPEPAGRPDMVPIPDTPYDPAMWTDSDDAEGLGVRDHHAP